MANITRSLADTAGFIPQNWANKALQVLRNAIVVAPVIARDSDFTDPGWKGKSITVPYPGTFAASDKTPGSLATVVTPTGGNSVTLSLTQHKTVDYILEDIAFSQAQQGVTMAENYGTAAGIALAEALEADLLTQIANFTLSSLGTIGTNLAGTVVQSAQKALDDAKAPASDRYLFYSTKDRNALLIDTNLAQWYAYAQQQAIGKGMIPGVYGFEGTAYSQLLPSATGAGSPSTIQIVTISGGATGGTFTLTYGAQTTTNIPFGAGVTTAASIAQALLALSSVPAGGKLYVTGSGLGPFQVWFAASWGVPTAITGSATNLTGGAPAIAITNGATAGQLGVAMHKNALMLATRPMANVSAAGVEVAVANDPASGISLRIQMQYQPQYRGVYVAYDILYGMTCLRPNQGVLLMS